MVDNKKTGKYKMETGKHKIRMKKKTSKKNRNKTRQKIIIIKNEQIDRK